MRARAVMITLALLAASATAQTPPAPKPKSPPPPAMPKGPPPAPAPAPQAPAEIDGAAIMGPGVEVLVARDDQERESVVIVAAGDGPGWEVLRVLAKDAFARLTSMQLVPASYGFYLQFVGNDRIALALPGQTPMVGNLHTMLDAPGDYAIAAAPTAKTVSKNFGFGDKSATCAGTVKNLGSEPLAVTVRCKIIGTFAGPLYTPPGRPKPTPKIAVMAEKTQELKAIKPGKSQKYSFGLGKLTYPPGESSYDFNGMNKLGFETGFEIDGKVMPYFDELAYQEGLAWLTLLDGARPLGFHLKPTGGKFERGGLSQGFSLPDDWSSRPAKAQKAAAKKLWDLVKKHQKKWFKKDLYTLYLVDDSIVFGDVKVENGKLVVRTR